MVRVLAWTVEIPGFGICLWGTGVSGLTRGLATLPQGGSRSLRCSEIRMEDPQEDPLDRIQFQMVFSMNVFRNKKNVGKIKER